MGYESRVFIVVEHEDGFWKEHGKPVAEVIARFNLCRCEDKVLEVFKEEAKNNVFDGGDEVIFEDCYGKPLTSADILDLYNAVEYGEYWRTTALKEFLHGIISNRDILSRDFESIKAYHFGY